MAQREAQRWLDHAVATLEAHHPDWQREGGR
jgi:hypothetical protein